MNDSPISADAVSVKPVNNDPPDPHYLPGMIELALNRLRSAAAAAARAISGAEMAKAAAGEVNDQAALCELDGIVDAVSDASDSLDDAQSDLESIYAERASEEWRLVDAGEGDIDEDDDVAGYLAVDQSTSDRVIDGFIVAVGADRVLGALDRLTAPVDANTTN